MHTAFILASQSPARLATLRHAGIDPIVHVSSVDEDAELAHWHHRLASLPLHERAELSTSILAQAKAKDVATKVRSTETPENDRDILVVGCDSMLAYDDQVVGKPHRSDIARQRWQLMRGHSAELVTGHHLILLHRNGSTWGIREESGTCTTTVHFADLSDAEIDAYIASTEPLEAAGGFTVDGLGGPFITRIEGDYHSVVGISLPLVRQLAIKLNIFWPTLWQ